MSCNSCIFFRSLVVFIEPNERGIILTPYQQAGYQHDVLKPGWHLIKLGERLQIYNISRQVYTMSSPDSIEAKTLDGKTIFVDISIIYALDPEKILDMHINWQDRYKDSLVRPLSRSIIRETISLYNLNEIGAQLSEVEQAIFNKLSMQFTENYLILLKFSIITFKSS
ncbi:MAG: SPFH domain-containing protein [Chloroflexota bacterium]